VFIDKLPGETETYKQKIAKRAPVVVNSAWENIAKPRGEKEHNTPANIRPLSDLQAVAKASKDETDHVFGHYKKAPEFKADVRNSSGKLTKKGNIHDAWAVEQERGKSAAYRKSSAKFWMKYLIVNDDDSSSKVESVKKINYAHHAIPEFEESTPKNDPATRIVEVVNEWLGDSKDGTTRIQRLFEIGRGWDAFNQSNEVYVQLFKKADPKEDRIFLWDMFLTLIHEYCHSLASGEYNTYANKLGGEYSPQGNALIEGVNTLLTEIVWTEARPRASRKEVREAVEPDAVKGKQPFDEKLLPLMPQGRYDTYDKALRLAQVVGIKNIYAAYFLGQVKLIGAK
jgi:hypothetical protein